MSILLSMLVRGETTPVLMSVRLVLLLAYGQKYLPKKPTVRLNLKSQLTGSVHYRTEQLQSTKACSIHAMSNEEAEFSKHQACRVYVTLSENRYEVGGWADGSLSPLALTEQHTQQRAGATLHLELEVVPAGLVRGMVSL